MKIGQLVLLVGSDGYMPPFGATGIVVGPLDWMGDHEVLFPDHPCPVGAITWEAHQSWLMPLFPPDIAPDRAVAALYAPSAVVVTFDGTTSKGSK